MKRLEGLIENQNHDRFIRKLIAEKVILVLSTERNSDRPTKIHTEGNWRRETQQRDTSLREVSSRFDAHRPDTLSRNKW